MMKYRMNEIDSFDAADGPVVSEGGRSPSTLSTGRAGRLTSGQRWSAAGEAGGPGAAGPALERGAQARGGAAADARRGGRAALARARPAAVQARAVAAEGRGSTRGGAEGARE